MDIWIIIRPGLDESCELAVTRNTASMVMNGCLSIAIYRTLDEAKQDHDIIGGLLLKTEAKCLKGYIENQAIHITDSARTSWYGEEKCPSLFYTEAILPKMKIEDGDQGEYYNPSEDHLRWLSSLSQATDCRWDQ